MSALGLRRRADRVVGRYEIVQNLVCCGLVGWAVAGKKFEAHELILPCIRLENTASGQIAAGLSRLFEAHVTGTGWQTFLHTISKNFNSIHFAVVADSAASNLRFLRHWLKYLRNMARDASITLTATFCPCLLHQMSRVVDLNLQRQGETGQSLSAALFSISRLSQHSVLREKTKKALFAELHTRFRWERGSPPEMPTNRAEFRSTLVQILCGTWGQSAPSAEEQQRLNELFTFFNGNLLQEEFWQHYCRGPECCETERAGLNKALLVGWAGVNAVAVSHMLVFV